MTEEDKLYADELRNRALADYERLDLAINELERQTCDSPHNNLTESSQDCISREAVGYYIQSYIHEIITESGTDKNEHTNSILRAILNGIKTMPSVTPKAEQKAVLDKIKAEILDEAEYAYADFDRYKEDILCAEPDELPDDDFRYGLERAVEIINKYKAESEV